jgi:hypothetical protein
MESGILMLTQKGLAALKTAPAELSPLCRNVLVQVDGKKSVEDINIMFRGLKGLDETIQRLFAGNYIQVSRACKDLVKALAQQMLGATSSALVNKIDDVHNKYGDACWDHLDELDKTARLFYGQVVADKFRTEVEKIISETKKTG